MSLYDAVVDAARKVLAVIPQFSWEPLNRMDGGNLNIARDELIEALARLDAEPVEMIDQDALRVAIGEALMRIDGDGYNGAAAKATCITAYVMQSLQKRRTAAPIEGDA